MTDSVNTGQMLSDEDKTLAQQFERIMWGEYDALSTPEKNNLSKVLFPETHTTEVQFMGETRTLRPTTVKYSRQLHNAVYPFFRKLSEAAKADRALEIDPVLLKSLQDCAVLLSEYYGWGDEVKTAILEENVEIEELQRLAVTQASLTGANDFLLAPLHTMIKVMQAREILIVKMRSQKTQNTSTTRV